jgi:uncharacterized protein (DUF1778 family)
VAHVSRSDRLDFRLSASHRRLIERAAAARGLPLTAFAVTALVQAAQAVINEETERKLSDRDRRRFLTALENEKVAPALARAARRYRSSS